MYPSIRLVGSQRVILLSFPEENHDIIHGIIAWPIRLAFPSGLQIESRTANYLEHVDIASLLSGW